MSSVGQAGPRSVSSPDGEHVIHSAGDSGSKSQCVANNERRDNVHAERSSPPPHATRQANSDSRRFPSPTVSKAASDSTSTVLPRSPGQPHVEGRLQDYTVDSAELRQHGSDPSVLENAPPIACTDRLQQVAALLTQAASLLSDNSRVHACCMHPPQCLKSQHGGTPHPPFDSTMTAVAEGDPSRLVSVSQPVVSDRAELDGAGNPCAPGSQNTLESDDARQSTGQSMVGVLTAALGQPTGNV
ncbi:hypothetical protein BC629DRAFT_648305 [Irpex lacteus]|nr:hypothetical protein BC629DRAFT_648305 [Irpex lacteus]